MIKIKQAQKGDIELIEQMMFKRIDELADKGILQWSKSDVSWKYLSLEYKEEDFYIVTADGEFAGSFCVVDYDPNVWINDPCGKYLYIHKIIVMEKYSGQGLGDYILSFFKDLGREAGVSSVKLDVRDYKKKLRRLYERNGFVLDHIAYFNGNEYNTCFYRYDIK